MFTILRFKKKRVLSKYGANIYVARFNNIIKQIKN